MADQIADLYAKIGFKISEEDLRKVKKNLSELKNLMSQIGSTTQRASASYGLLSRQQIKLEQQKIKQSTEWWKHQSKIIDLTKQRESQQFKERQQRYKEDLDTKKKVAAEDQKIQQQTTQSQKREAKKRVDIAKGLATTFRRIKQIVGSASWAISGLGKFMGDSTTRAISTRDFMRYTGTQFDTLQDIEERFASIGSQMNRESIMGELSSAMRNITNISYGQGDLFGFKIAGLSQAAASRDVTALLRELKYALVGVEPQDRVKVLESLGLSRSWMPYFDEQIKGVEGARIPRLSLEEQKKLEESGNLFRTLNLAIERTKDKFNATLAPALSQASKSLYDFATKFFEGETGKHMVELIEGTVKSFGEWASNLTPADIDIAVKSFSSFMDALGAIGRIIDNTLGVVIKLYDNIALRAARWFGNEWGNAFADVFFGTAEGKMKNAKIQAAAIIEEGRKGFIGWKEGDAFSEFYAKNLFGRDIASAKNFYKSYLSLQSGNIPPTVNANTTINNTFNGLEQKEIADTAISKMSEEFSATREKLAYKDVYVFADAGTG